MSDDILDADAIDVLRLKAFQTNKPADRDAYHRAVSKWFQARHAREMRREMEVADQPAVKALVAEAEARGMERAAGIVRSHGDVARTTLRGTYDAGDAKGNSLWGCIVGHLDIADDAIRAEATAIRKGE